MQSLGGVHCRRADQDLAIPVSTINLHRRRACGCVPGPTTAVRKGDALYARDKKGKLRLLYVLKDTSGYRSVPFYGDRALSMQAGDWSGAYP